VCPVFYDGLPQAHASSVPVQLQPTDASDPHFTKPNAQNLISIDAVNDRLPVIQCRVCIYVPVYLILLLMLLLVLPPLADEYVGASPFNPVPNARNR
jgi:hypothetical protein